MEIGGEESEEGRTRGGKVRGASEFTMNSQCFQTAIYDFQNVKDSVAPGGNSRCRGSRSENIVNS